MQASGDGERATRAATVYRGFRSRRSAPVLGEINVTPLVDVVLVLLLVFMVTAPMMSRGIDVSLPVANQPQIEPRTASRSRSTRDEPVFVGDQPVNLLLLEDELRGMMERPVGQGRLPARRRSAALRQGHRGGGQDEEGGRRADRLRLRAARGEGSGERARSTA